jgi:hypothetical protein
MYFPRRADAVLEAWATGPDRKPLVLRGARQTGKSSLVRDLGRRFELFLELDLERRADLALVRTCSSPADLLAALAARHDLVRFPERTLLFLDEVQESPEAIRWLRFFHEDHPELAVVAAGSLLEVRLQERGFSFPVGRVTFRTLRPFGFLEFLSAVGKEVLAGRLVESVAERKPLPAPLHAQALEQLASYLLVGGMPEAVARWTETRNLAAVRQVHGDLLQAFAEDIQKYRGARDLAYLEAAFEALPHHYGLRFKYERFAPGFRSALMKSALGKLDAAMLVTRVLPTSSTSLPLRSRPRSAPKLLPLDVGLALSSMGAGIDQLRQRGIEALLDGRAAEIFAGQELLWAGEQSAEPLHFWVSESARGAAEVDYLVAARGVPVPVEVKAARAGALRSLHQFLAQASTKTALRLYTGSFADERLRVALPGGELAYRLISLPLYLAGEIPRLAGGLDG